MRRSLKGIIIHHFLVMKDLFKWNNLAIFITSQNLMVIKVIMRGPFKIYYQTAFNGYKGFNEKV